MPKPVALFLLSAVIFTSPVLAKKKKQELPDLVPNAKTVVVMPDLGEPLNHRSANRIAQDNVERALPQWGRFRLVPDVPTADLFPAVRAGRESGPTLYNSPADNRPVIVQPGDRNIRLGRQPVRPPEATDPGLGSRAGSDPRIGTDLGSVDDSLEVYRGGVERPLDAAPVWRYTAKNALKQPPLSAVEQFRKAIENSSEAAPAETLEGQARVSSTTGYPGNFPIGKRLGKIAENLLKKDRGAMNRRSWLCAMMSGSGMLATRTLFASSERDKFAVANEDVKELLLLMDADKSGRISKQEWMNFMEAEFNRLAKDGSGELDVNELKQTAVSIKRTKP